MTVKTVRVLFYVACSLAAGLAAAGCLAGGLWYGALVMTAFSLLRVLLRRRAPTVFLIVSVILGAAGILLGAEPLCLVLFAGLSLAAWDLAGAELLVTRSGRNSDTGSYLAARLGSLATVTALGAALTLVIGRIHFHAPFPLLLGLAVAAFVSGGAAVLFYRRKSTISGSGATNPPKNRIL